MGEKKEKEKIEAAPVLGPRTFEIRAGEGPGYIGKQKLVPDVGTGHSKPIAVTRSQLATLVGCKGIDGRALQGGKELVPWTSLKKKGAIALIVGKKKGRI